MSSGGVFKSLNVVLNANVLPFSSNMRVASGTLRTFSNEVNALNVSSAKAAKSAGDLEGAMSRSALATNVLKGSLLAVGVGAAVGIGAAAKAAFEFDKNMHNVTSLLSASSDSAAAVNQQFLQLSNGVLQISKTVPQSAKDLSAGLYDIVSSGFTRTDDALALLKASSSAAAAGLTDTKTAAAAITGVINAYGYSAKQAGIVSDVLFQTVNVGVVNFEQLAQGIGEVNAVAAAAHVPIQDVGAAIAAVTRAGIQPAEAFTGLTRTIQQILNPSVELTKQLNEMGYATGQQALETIGLNGVIDQLRQRSNGAATAIDAMFTDVRAQRTVFALMSNGGKTYAETVKQIAEGNVAAGATTKAFAEQSKSVVFQFDLLRNTLNAAAIAGFDKLSPSIAHSMGDLTKFSTDGIGGLGAAVRAVRPDLEDIGGLVTDIGRGVGMAAHDVAPFAGALAGLGGSGTLAVLGELAHDLDDVAQYLERNRVLFDALALIVTGKYVASLAAAVTTTLGLAGAQVAMRASTALATVGLTAESLAAEEASLRLAGLADTSAGARAGLAGLAGFANPLTLAVAALGGAFLLYEQGQKSAKQEVDALTAALEHEGIAAQISAQQILTNQLAHARYQQVIRGVGTNEATVTQAIEGHRVEQDALAQSLITSSRTLQDHVRLQQLLRDALSGNKDAAHQLNDTLGHTGSSSDAQLGGFVSKLSDLSSNYKKADDSARSAAVANKQFGDSAQFSEAGLRNIALGAGAAAENMAQLSAVQQQFEKDLAGFTSPKTAFDNALQAAQKAQQATQSETTKSTKENTTAQRQAITDSANAQIRALQEEKTHITNNNAQGRSEIQKNIDAIRNQEAEQKSALKTTQDTSSGAAKAVKDANQEATVSEQAYVAELKKETQDRKEWLDNLAVIASSAGADISGELAKLGPTGASLVSEIAGNIRKNTPQAQQATKDLIGAIRDNINGGMSDIADDSARRWQILAVKNALGAQATAKAIADALGLGVQDVLRIAQQYSIALTDIVNPTLTALGKAPIVVDKKLGQTIHIGGSAGGRAVFAEGGIENHVAQIAPGRKPYRIWAEEETGGEAYIPLAPSKRSRSKDILAQTAAIFGLGLTSGGHARHFADGGFQTGPFKLPLPPKLPDWLVAQMGDGADQTAYKAALAYAQQSAASQSYGGSASAAPKGSVVDWIHAAEAIAGWPDAYTNGIYNLIMHESGGNPHAINLTDSNAAAGHPSKGLTQTIDGTFNANKFPGHGDIYNPVDNILAGISYALKRYGPQMVTAGGRRDKAGNYLGYAEGGIRRGTYDSGGPLMPGWTMAYNGTGKTEHVFTQAHIDRIVKAIETKAGGGNHIIVQATAESTEELARRTARKLRPRL